MNWYLFQVFKSLIYNWSKALLARIPQASKNSAWYSWKMIRATCQIYNQQSVTQLIILKRRCFQWLNVSAVNSVNNVGFISLQLHHLWRHCTICLMYWSLTFKLSCLSSFRILANRTKGHDIFFKCLYLLLHSIRITFRACQRSQPSLSITAPSVISLADETRQTTSEVSFPMKAVSTLVTAQQLLFKTDEILFF